ncbi:glycosyltransferase family 4 protein [Fervidobacterium pennivorans]|uniref:glycosyltransferase family 4 protein n=1 Tax=Fervidobacterium pennivorans TaxID=93466 RepID=UPI0014367F2A|nr:glycosyltransferase family 4 protein [Fervidobacterium pennivorans]QIV77658.1 glycosyltransferase family 4 protein [Fervidobacterium pennivorans subsp. keratinolyticus]
MKKVLMIGYMHTKYDKRVFRTVQALSKYAKVIYQYLTDKSEHEYEEGNVWYVPIRWYEDINANAIAKLWKRRMLDRTIMEFIKKTEFDILYMHHFLPTRPIEPFRYAKRNGRKVVYDVHEYHPENFLSNLNGVIGNLKIRLMKKIFDKQIDLSDKLIFVSQEMMRYSIGNRAKDVLVFPNYAGMITQSGEKRKEIVFVGKITRALGDEKQIIKELIKEGFVFKIIGMDSNVFSDIEHVYTGFLPYEKMMQEIAKATFSLVSFKTIESENYKNDLWSLPHKFYDSLAAGTPVIVKESFPSMRTIVEELGVGVVIDPKDVESSVGKILEAYRNYDQLIENIENHKKKFVWDEAKEKEFVEFVLS